MPILLLLSAKLLLLLCPRFAEPEFGTAKRTEGMATDTTTASSRPARPTGNVPKLRCSCGYANKLKAMRARPPNAKGPASCTSGNAKPPASVQTGESRAAQHAISGQQGNDAKRARLEVQWLLRFG
jgi:hypothetical protein